MSEQNATTNYKDKIIKTVQEINDEKLLRRIYLILVGIMEEQQR